MEYNKNIVKLVYSLKQKIDSFLTDYIEQADSSDTKGLMVSHGNILIKLYEQDCQPMSKLADDIAKCKSTLTVLVDKLEKAGFVQRVVDENDTRIKKICLTQKGKSFQKDFWEISELLNKTLWENFSDDEKQNFLTMLLKANANMTNVPSTQTNAQYVNAVNKGSVSERQKK